MAANSLRILNIPGSVHATRKGALGHCPAWHVFRSGGQRSFQGGTVVIPRVPEETWRRECGETFSFNGV